MFWSFSFSISPSRDYSGLASFRTDWFGLLGVQGTLNQSVGRAVERVATGAGAPGLGGEVCSGPPRHCEQEAKSYHLLGG